MKGLFTIISIGISALACGQKINAHTYKNVLSVLFYNDGQVIEYEKNGRTVKDTLYFYKMKLGINIEFAKNVIYEDRKIKN